MLEILGAFLGGGGVAIITELLNFFDRKNSRAHELAMAEAGLDKTELESISKVSEAASQPMEYPKTGYKIVDAFLAFIVVLNASVRPVITYWWVLVMYSIYKYALWTQLQLGWADKAVQLWTNQDMAIVTAIIGFWFVARQLRKGQTSAEPSLMSRLSKFIK